VTFDFNLDVLAPAACHDSRPPSSAMLDPDRGAFNRRPLCEAKRIAGLMFSRRYSSHSRVLTFLRAALEAS